MRNKKKSEKEKFKYHVRKKKTWSRSPGIGSDERVAADQSPSGLDLGSVFQFVYEDCARAMRLLRVVEKESVRGIRDRVAQDYLRIFF